MRAEKAEEEVQELMNKARQLEIELGMFVLSSHALRELHQVFIRRIYYFVVHVYST
jgi:hypothetical protein